MKRKTKAPSVTVQALTRTWHDNGQVWRVYRGGALVGFVEKFDEEPDTVHPFKVFRALCGYGGPPRRGDMVAADYVAFTAQDAAERNASRLS